MRRVIWIALPFVVLATLFLAIFPTRSLLDQRSRKAKATKVLTTLEQHNTKLDDEVRQLHTDAEIERLAREQYNLVKPGEEAYAILPGRAGSPTTTTAPPPRKAP
jgi:cell division protein FtsB